MRLPWRRREARQAGGGFEASLLAAIDDAAATGGKGAESASVATVSACAGLWADTLAGLPLTGPEALSGRFLAAVGHDLIRRGVSRWAIRVRDGRIVLERPAVAQRVSRGWLLSWNRDPGDARTERVLDSEVLNLRWEHSPANDWDGIAPWAGLSGRLAGELEATLGDEAAGPAGSVLVAKLGGHPDQAALGKHAVGLTGAPGGGSPTGGQLNLRGKRRGSLVVIPGQQPGQQLQGDNTGRPMRIGAAWPEAVATLRGQLPREIAAACEVPPELVLGGAGMAVREAWRLFGLRVQGRARRLAEDLADALGQPVTIAADGIGLADLMSRTRSLKSMIDAGIELADARRIAGLT